LSVAERNAARIGVLDDGNRGASLRIEFGDQLVGRVGVVEIVVGQLLALDLRGGRDAEALLGRAVERSPLMGVLAVAQRRVERAGDHLGLRRVLAEHFGEPGGDRSVISGCAPISLSREGLAQLERRAPAILLHLGEHKKVVGGLDHDGDTCVVLGAGADQRRPADVDVLDAVGKIGAA
jgi:hypothetical protein